MRRGQDMKSVRLTMTIAALFTVFLLPLSTGRAVNPAKGENHCFTCHTSARTLIKITREIAETSKSRSGPSPENKGEG